MGVRRVSSQQGARKLHKSTRCALFRYSKSRDRIEGPEAALAPHVGSFIICSRFLCPVLSEAMSERGTRRLTECHLERLFQLS